MRKGGKLDGWKVEKLGDIGKVSMCKRIFKDQTTTTGDIPFYKIGTFGKEPDAYISKEIYDEFRNKFSFPKKGDILISASGTIGRRVKYDGEPAYFQDSNIIWIDNDEKQVLNDYLYHFYGACNWNSTKGATISRLYTTNLQQLEIPVPPLPEQQRIVSVLDEAFASIAQAKSNVERNLVNARELFETLLNNEFSKSTEDWKFEKLKNITTKIGSGATPLGGEKSYKTNGISLIRSLNVYDQGFWYQNLAFLDNNQADKLSNVTVESGDVLLNITGASVARCCIVPDNVLPARVNQHVSIIRLVKDEMLPEFLHYALISKVNKDKLLNTGEKGGSTRQALTKAQIEDFTINYPPLAEQRAIVGRLEALSAETGRLEEIYQQKVESLEELKKSVLAKAFSGEI